MDNVLKHECICKQLNKIYKKKNHDYGDSFHKSWQEYGDVMLAIRLEDKLNRFKSLIKSEAMVDESIEDTLLDLANYAIMGVIELQKDKGVEMFELASSKQKDGIMLFGNMNDMETIE